MPWHCHAKKRTRACVHVLAGSGKDASRGARISYGSGGGQRRIPASAGRHGHTDDADYGGHAGAAEAAHADDGSATAAATPHVQQRREATRLLLAGDALGVDAAHRQH
eukprot:4868730-Prymnesium_polylepis.1